MKIIIGLLITFFIIDSTFARDLLSDEDMDLKPTKNRTSTELILKNDAEFSPTFNNRFSFQADVNPNPRQMTSVKNFNFSYANKFPTYWLDFNFQVASGFFNKMTTNNAQATSSTEDQLYNVNSTQTSLGVGLLYQSNYSASLFSSASLYETTSAYLTYNMYKVSSLSDTFQGPGFMAKYSLCKKFTDFFSVGINLNYLLAVVKGPVGTSGNESSSARSLTLSYVTTGIDISFSL